VTDRPRRLVVVAGTGTEVGKTWVGAHLLASARAAGLRVAARKVAQSFDPGTGPTDAEVLAAATGEAPEDVCPPHRSYEVAVAPFMAAERLGRPPFTLPDLVAEVRWPEGVDLGLVEPAGGVRSPMTADGADTVDLVAAVAPDAVLLVADAGLGTINAVRLSLDALTGSPVIVVLNRFDEADELHRANRAWLADHLPADVVTDVAILVAGLGPS
jgi:dethiobiotin synthetase